MAFAPACTPDALPGSARSPWIAALVPLLLTLALGVHAMRAWQVHTTQPTDFRIFYEASVDLHAGADPYRDAPTHFPYIYPPLLAWAIGPLTALSLPAAAEVWVLVSFAAWIVLAAMALKLARSDHGGVPLALVVLPSLLAYRFVLRLNLHGQVDLVLWALVAEGACLLHERRAWAAGALLGTALVIKPLPVLFLAAMAWQRRGTALAVALVTMCALLGAPALTEGPARTGELLAQWAGGRIGRDLTDVGFEVHNSNQSLQALLFRHLAVRTTEPGEPWPTPAARLAPAEVNRCFLALAFAIVLPLPFLLGRGTVSRRRWGVEVALLACATHLISRRTMEYHLVSLVLVDTVLLGLALCPGVAPGWRRLAGLTLAAAAVLENFYAPPLVGKAASLALQSRGFTTLSLVLVWGFLCALLSRWETVLAPGGTKLPRP